MRVRWLVNGTGSSPFTLNVARMVSCKGKSPGILSSLPESVQP